MPEGKLAKLFTFSVELTYCANDLRHAHDIADRILEGALTSSPNAAAYECNVRVERAPLNRNGSVRINFGSGPHARDLS
jgi:hypothetical protein